MKKGWEMKKLGELSKKKDDVVSGPFGSNLKVSDYKDEGVPILRLQNIGKGHFIDKSIKFINEKKAEELKYHSFISGDIALAKLGIPIGKTCIIPNKFKLGIITADIVRIRPDTKIVSSKYLEYFLNTDLSVGQLTGNISGATRPRVNLSDVRNIKIPIPLLPEQQRIVSILDEAFAAIDQAKENVQRNLQNAKELFQSELNSVFSNGGEDWVKKTLGELVEFLNGFAFKSSDAIESSKTQLLRMGNLYQNRLGLERSPVFYPDNFGIAFKKYVLKEDDLIISLTGTTGKEDYGFTVRIPKTESTLLLNQRISKIIIKDEKSLNKNLLFHFLISRVFLDILYSTANGTRQANLSTETMKELYFCFPKDVKQQEAITLQLDTLSNKTKKLETLYQQKLNSLEELKKGILQKAFNGELTENNVVV